MGYTPGMKTAVSIPDDVFEQADRLASRLGTSRSALYSRALVEFMAQHDADDVTDRWNAALDDLGEVDTEFVMAAAARTLRDVEW